MSQICSQDISLHDGEYSTHLGQIHNVEQLRRKCLVELALSENYQSIVYPCRGKATSTSDTDTSCPLETSADDLDKENQVKLHRCDVKLKNLPPCSTKKYLAIVFCSPMKKAKPALGEESTMSEGSSDTELLPLDTKESIRTADLKDNTGKPTHLQTCRISSSDVKECTQLQQQDSPEQTIEIPSQTHSGEDHHGSVDKDSHKKDICEENVDSDQTLEYLSVRSGSRASTFSADTDSLSDITFKTDSHNHGFPFYQSQRSSIRVLGRNLCKQDEANPKPNLSLMASNHKIRMKGGSLGSSQTKHDKRESPLRKKRKSVGRNSNKSINTVSIRRSSSQQRTSDTINCSKDFKETPPRRSLEKKTRYKRVIDDSSSEELEIGHTGVKRTSRDSFNDSKQKSPKKWKNRSPKVIARRLKVGTAADRSEECTRLEGLVAAMEKNNKVVSFDPKDVCRFWCELCSSDINFDMLRFHLKINHNTTLEEYDEEHGIKISRLVFHACFKCGEEVVSSKANIREHIEAHNMDIKEYTEGLQKSFKLGSKAQCRIKRRSGKEDSTLQDECSKDKEKIFIGGCDDKLKEEDSSLQMIGVSEEETVDSHDLDDNPNETPSDVSSIMGENTASSSLANGHTEAVNVDIDEDEVCNGVEDDAANEKHQDCTNSKMGTVEKSAMEAPEHIENQSKSRMRESGNLHLLSESFLEDLQYASSDKSTTEAENSIDVVNKGTDVQGPDYSVRFSDTPGDFMIYQCCICEFQGEYRAIQKHISQVHNSTLRQYSAKHGKLTFREKVLHECKICQTMMEYVKDSLQDHLRYRHSHLTVEMYTAKYLMSEGTSTSPEIDKVSDLRVAKNADLKNAMKNKLSKGRNKRNTSAENSNDDDLDCHNDPKHAKANTTPRKQKKRNNSAENDDENDGGENNHAEIKTNKVSRKQSPGYNPNRPLQLRNGNTPRQKPIDLKYGRFSDVDGDYSTFQCHICPFSGFYLSMRSHVSNTHRLKYKSYKEKYGTPLFKDEVLHKCRECNATVKYIQEYLCAHLKSHSMTRLEYDKKHFNLDPTVTSKAPRKRNSMVLEKEGLLPSNGLGKGSITPSSKRKRISNFNDAHPTDIKKARLLRVKKGANYAESDVETVRSDSVVDEVTGSEKKPDEAVDEVSGRFSDVPGDYTGDSNCLKTAESEDQPDACEEQAKQSIEEIVPESKRFSKAPGDYSTYKCLICNYIGKSPKLRLHINRKHNLTSTQYKKKYGDLRIFELVNHRCQICQKVYQYNKENVRSHLKIVHDISLGIYTEQFLLQINKSGNVSLGKRKKSSGIINKPTKKARLAKNQKQAKYAESDGENTDMSDSAGSASRDHTSTKRFKLKDCGKNWFDGTEYNCSKCSFTVHSPEAMDHHLKLAHNVKRPKAELYAVSMRSEKHKCLFCGVNVFPEKIQLKKHLAQHFLTLEKYEKLYINVARNKTKKTKLTKNSTDFHGFAAKEARTAAKCKKVSRIKNLSEVMESSEDEINRHKDPDQSPSSRLQVHYPFPKIHVEYNYMEITQSKVEDMNCLVKDPVRPTEDWFVYVCPLCPFQVNLQKLKSGVGSNHLLSNHKLSVVAFKRKQLRWKKVTPPQALQILHG